MKELGILGLLLALYGCESVPSGQWVQEGGTEAQMREAMGHCEKVGMLESDGMRSTDPFKEEIVKQNCMRRMGYTYVKLPPK